MTILILQTVFDMRLVRSGGPRVSLEVQRSSGTPPRHSLSNGTVVMYYVLDEHAAMSPLHSLPISEEHNTISSTRQAALQR
jgi:hypothetical protein